ncbi:MAG: hypothetical protein MJ102_03245 [Clostridia bacterium]|nr:hypothetical protein [Clostridia bacterium]
MKIFNTIAAYAVVFLPAILALVLLVFALVRYIIANKQSDIRKSRKGLLIAASVLLGIVAAAYATIIILLALAIRNM